MNKVKAELNNYTWKLEWDIVSDKGLYGSEGG